jgi:hypothetical protein
MLTHVVTPHGEVATDLGVVGLARHGRAYSVGRKAEPVIRALELAGDHAPAAQIRAAVRAAGVLRDEAAVGITPQHERPPQTPHGSRLPADVARRRDRIPAVQRERERVVVDEPQVVSIDRRASCHPGREDERSGDQGQ